MHQACTNTRRLPDRARRVRQVSKLESELLRVSAECHRLQQAAAQSKAKYEEELALYKAMLQRLRTAS
jgi:hypothetical protein